MSLSLPRFSRPIALSMLTAVVLAGGCAVGPHFVAPQPKIPTEWHAAGTSAPPGSDRISVVRPESSRLAAWWLIFKDPELNSLIERAATANLDVQGALLRVAEARAARQGIAADLWPSVSGNASFSRTRVSDKTALGSVLVDGNAALPGIANPFNQSQVGFDASWELDVFGHMRRLVEAADADAQATLEQEHDALLTLMGDVARAYVELRGHQLRLAITLDNLKTQRDVLEITRDRQMSGLGNDLDVANASAQLATTQALVPDLKRQIAQSINQLSLLLGREPAALHAELESTRAVPAPPPEVPIGLPSELVRRRPDIRRAEAALHAAVARVGVAEADLFPRLTLNVGAAFQAQRAADLGSWASRFLSLGPTLELPILDGGRRRATLRLQNLQERESAVTYERTVLEALHDVENALVAYGTEQDRRAALSAAVAASQTALDLSRLRYSTGVTAFLDVLDAERNLEQTELAEAQSTVDISIDLVALYKALGGGWES
jgi:NodT family efflux transporter outer membrane factor (OMF) lipoprotein